MEDQRNLSLPLYDVLEKVGASEKTRKLHKRSSTVVEILQTARSILLDRDLSDKSICYMCGSTYEGTVTPALSSDIDEITCYTFPPVVFDPCEATNEAALLVVRDEWTYPGYVKLQVILDGIQPPEHVLRTSDPVHGTDDLGRLCGRHFTGENMSGPADKRFSEKGVHYLDIVRAFKCKTVPSFASKRLDQINRRGLITDVALDKLKKSGCMFVCAGYFMSQEKELEWRMSLSLQERYLMSKLNPTQHKVYILLKMIKKTMIENDADCDILTSYHCKTCMLYAVEITQAKSWTPDNIIICLLQCIKLLILWLKSNFCPNFFNGDQNLFSKAGFSNSKRRKLLQTMECLLLSNNRFLSCIETDNVGHILLEGVDRWRNVMETAHAEYRYNIHLKTIRVIVRSSLEILHGLCGDQCSVSSLVSALDSVHQIDTISEHTPTQTKSALNYLKPWFHLHLAKSLACLSYSCQDRPFRIQMMRAADFHFLQAENIDLVNVRLGIASVLYKSDQHFICFLLLQQIEEDFTNRILRVCPCVCLCTRMYRNAHDKHVRHKAFSSMTVGRILPTFIARCVTFLPSQIPIVPVPLRYEMFRSRGTQPGSRNSGDFWFDWCVADAIVFLYLMQYMVSVKLRKEEEKHAAICKLRTEIEQDELSAVLYPESLQSRTLGHKETAYNLLGWIYMQEQRYGDAMQCFFRSWEIRPFHNAAKYHMRDLWSWLRAMFS